MKTLSLKQTQIGMILVVLLLGVILALWPRVGTAQTVATREQAESVLAIDNVTVQDGTVTGQIRNQTKNTVRDVQLSVIYSWLWTDERHPGKDNPGAAFYPTLAGEIAPGGSMPFKFTPSPPLAKRTDGEFETPTVAIAGFTQVISQSR